MPVLKHAIKKLRVDARRASVNKRVRTSMRGAIKTFKVKPAESGLSSVFSAIDKAAKSGIVHPRKASRLKSRLTKSIAKKAAK